MHFHATRIDPPRGVSGIRAAELRRLSKLSDIAQARKTNFTRERCGAIHFGRARSLQNHTSLLNLPVRVVARALVETVARVTLLEHDAKSKGRT